MMLRRITPVSILSKISVRSSVTRCYAQETRKNLNVESTESPSQQKLNVTAAKYAKRAPLRQVFKESAQKQGVKLGNKDADELARYYVKSQKSKLKAVGLEPERKQKQEEQDQDDEDEELTEAYEKTKHRVAVSVLGDPMYAKIYDHKKAMKYKKELEEKYPYEEKPLTGIFNYIEDDKGRTTSKPGQVLRYLVEGYQMAPDRAQKIFMKMYNAKAMTEREYGSKTYIGTAGGKNGVRAHVTGLGRIINVEFLDSRIKELPHKYMNNFIVSAVSDAINQGRSNMYKRSVEINREFVSDIHQGLEDYEQYVLDMKREGLNYKDENYHEPGYTVTLDRLFGRFENVMLTAEMDEAETIGEQSLEGKDEDNEGEQAQTDDDYDSELESGDDIESDEDGSSRKSHKRTGEVNTTDYIEDNEGEDEESAMLTDIETDSETDTADEDSDAEHKEEDEEDGEEEIQIAAGKKDKQVKHKKRPSEQQESTRDPWNENMNTDELLQEELELNRKRKKLTLEWKKDNDIKLTNRELKELEQEIYYDLYGAEKEEEDSDIETGGSDDEKMSDSDSGSSDDDIEEKSEDPHDKITKEMRW
jgi:hypothetical protein